MSSDRPTISDSPAIAEAPLKHPGDEALRALSLGQLSDEELTDVSAHLGECPACCRRIDQLATDDPLLVRLQQSAASPVKVLVTPAQRRPAVRALRESHQAKASSQKRASELKPVILPAPKQIGDYEILAEVGRGGMGVVYKARHRSLRRLAALKMVLAGEFASPTQELRFRLEAELAARVQHPNIVQVYEIGNYEGRPFLALEWVEGGSLANILNGKPWPAHEAAALIETLARAMDAAHSEGVIHRDLKPANVLLAVERGGWRVEGGNQGVEGGGWSVEGRKQAKPQQGEGDEGSELQGTRSLADKHGSSRDMLQGDQGLPKGRAFRADQSDSPGGRVDPGEHSGRSGTGAHERVSSAPECCEGLGNGAGNSSNAESASRVDRREQDGAPSPPNGADQPHALRTPQGAGETPLSTLHPSPSTLHQSSHSPLPTPHSPLLPKITDFGLAQTIEGSHTMTQSGFLVGTPGYMAPEQACGKRALVGPGTDIYALGVILYQLITGQLPFQRDSTLELLQSVTSDEPVRPRRLLPRLPRDLEAITLHCLEKEPRRRYATALALAEDLRRFQEGKQVAARPVGAAARVIRACRRRPLVASLIALLVASVLGGLAGVSWKWLEANEQRDLANAHARQADSEKQAALYQAYRASLAAASGALLNHDVADAARNLESAPGAQRGWEWRHLSNRLDDSSRVVPLPAGADCFLIPSSDRLWVGVWNSDGLRLLDLEGSNQRILPLGPEHRSRVQVAHTRRGFRVVAGVGKSGTDLLDDAGHVVCRIFAPANANFSSFAISQDGARLAGAYTADDRSRIAVYDAATGKQTAICDGHHDVIWTLTISPDGTKIASGSGGDDPTARIWNAADGTLVAVCQGHRSKIDCVAFSMDSSQLVTTSSDRTVRQWDAKTGEEIEAPYDRHASEVYSAVYSPDGKWVASASADRTIRVWHAKGRQEVAVLHGHTGRVAELAFAPDGRRLASLSCRSTWVIVGDDTARVWDLDPDATLPALRGHMRGIYPVAYSPNGRWLASGSWDNTWRLWDAATGEPCAVLRQSSFIWDLVFGPDSTWLVSTSDDDRLRVWDMAAARVRKEIPVPGRIQQSLTVSPDGTRAAVTTIDPKNGKPQLIVCDIASGKLLLSSEGHSLAYSPDGRWLAALTEDAKTVLLLDARTHETVARLSGHENIVFKAAFSPDCRLLATCSRDRTVRLWQIDPASSTPHSPLSTPHSSSCQVLRGHTDEVFAVAFHPDGTRLATAGRDGAISLWDLTRNEEVVRLPWHRSFVWSLAFSPNGATLASGSGDCTVGLWDTAPLKNRYQARREAAALRPEAERLVEKLWREQKAPEEVVQAIRADKASSEALRHEALRAVLRRSLPPEAVPGDPRDPP